MSHRPIGPRRMHDWTVIREPEAFTTEAFADPVYMDYAQPRIAGGVEPDLTIQPAFKAVVELTVVNPGTADNTTWKVYVIGSEAGQSDIRGSSPFITRTLATSSTTPYYHFETLDWDDFLVGFQVSVTRIGSTDALVALIRVRKYRIA